MCTGSRSRWTCWTRPRVKRGRPASRLGRGRPCGPGWRATGAASCTPPWRAPRAGATWSRSCRRTGPRCTSRSPARRASPGGARSDPRPTGRMPSICGCSCSAASCPNRGSRPPGSRICGRRCGSATRWWKHARPGSNGSRRPCFTMACRRAACAAPAARSAWSP